MGEHGPLRPGEVFAGYTIERVLGVGGMGTVYAAAHPRLPRRIALKVLHPALAEDDDARSRFELEADHAARLEHPNIVAVYDRGREGDRLWIAMQYVDGTDAETAREGAPLDPARAVRIITETAKALDYAHEAGVLHRDVKPANILLEHPRPGHPGDPGRVLLADFGIAKALEHTQHLTKTGMLVASLQYAAPEQFASIPLDARADVYSLGCTLFRLLTGQQPYPGSTLAQLMAGHLNSPIPRPAALRAGLPTGFDAVITRAMAKDREHRYPSCGALAAAAQHALGPPQADIPTLVREVPETDRYPAPGPHGPKPGPQPAAPTARRQETEPARAHPAASAEPFGHAPDLERLEHPRARIRWWRRTSTVVIAVILTLLAVATVGVVVYRQTQTPTQTTETETETQTQLPFTSLSQPEGVAVDTVGSVYVTDHDNNQVLKLAAGSTTQTVLPFTGLSQPEGVTVDTVGSVYVTDHDNNRVLKLTAGSNSATALPFTDLRYPRGVAVDGSGGIYVTDTGTGRGDGRVLKLAAGSTTQIVLPFTGETDWVALNAAEDVFFSQFLGSRVMMLAGGSNSATALPFTDLYDPSGVAVDTTGTVYVADSGNARVLKLVAGSTTQTELPFTGISGPTGVAIDTAGNVYVADTDHGRVLRLAAG
ncbi:serine/threonine protein kinase (plasmid) [Rhodococcus jostii RHA1]|jgi:non-specific serine/threonine protein kinase/serine/threonine-protein kinase|uniref:non-specific serine/threonine protein kinase n=2 Tax=Rhodococcus TaxID=1827 RepID=Q0RYQ2_RHOJR|nr:MULTISPECIES: serine/threonine-protein kinase PknD [Rhodococcus]ABG99584.1 serine/threonine protein kinase [Rhodococcus jostii RHA1]EID79236.1 serine/threonine protein kinase [Rhodococcus opacus RKJ300 = JCM 13270]QQZ19001.1 protein kinase [Rhodococcus sp. 21391]